MDKFKKWLLDTKHRTIFTIIVGTVLILVVLILKAFFSVEHHTFNDYIQNIWDQIINGDVLSTLLAFVFAAFLAVGVDWWAIRQEDKKKSTEDYQGLIKKYERYDVHNTEISTKENFFEEEKETGKKAIGKKAKDGSYQYLTAGQLRHEKVKNTVKDKSSPAYFKMTDIIEDYRATDGYLTIPSIQSFVNTTKNAHISFQDTAEEDNLPGFVHQNEVALIKAHEHAKPTNNESFRLNGIAYNDATNVVTLTTARTTYYHMMLTNRCMDYDFGNGLTLRTVYEFRRAVNNLGPNNPLSNQIGINGIIITKDGWLILEKRDHRKSTWKSKFAQPISFGMTLRKAGFRQGQTIAPGTDVAEDLLANMISGTIKDNFGFVSDYAAKKSGAEGASIDYHLDISTNFMGVARDLIEGGKPNLYFFVVLDLDHKEAYKRIDALKNDNPAKIKKVKDTHASIEKLVDNSSKNIASCRKNGTDYKGSGAFTKEKLKTSWVLIHMDDIKINFAYKMKLNWADKARKPLIVRRHEPPFRGVAYGVCEALLSCISMAEQMKLRDYVLNKGGNTNGK